jgi:hypothetical protein
MHQSADQLQKCFQLSPMVNRLQFVSASPNRMACRRNLTWVVFLGIFSVSFASTMGAQPPAPQTLPYFHTIVAGSGVGYTPAALTGSTTTPVHGTAPGDGGPATAAAVQLNNPTGLVADSLGNLYITDTNGNIRKIDTQGNISTFAGGIAAGKGGKTICPGGADVNGNGCPANEAFLNAARGIAIDPATGDFYIAEATGNRIRKISHDTYLISAVVGTGSKASTNGDLAACTTGCSGTPGAVSGPRDLGVDKRGNVYIADTGNSAVRLANFDTGQLTTVANTSFTKGVAGTTCLTTTTTTAGAANMGSVQSISFDKADNLYVADATCNVIWKLTEDPSTGMVDSNSAISVVLGNGTSTPAQTIFTNVLGTTVTVTPSSVRADPSGNLYVGESTGTHVWFWDATTGYMHTVYGGGNPGDCFGVPASGTAPYSGCDGFHSSPAATSGTPGLALDAWGNLYIADNSLFYVHKLSLGTSAPFIATVPAGSPNVLLHFGANDTYASLDTSLAPDFSFVKQTCTTNNGVGQDRTSDCTAIIANAVSSPNPQYEQATVTSASGLKTAIPLTNEVYPICQPATATTNTVQMSGATAVALTSQLGAGCAGYETLVAAPHKYTYAVLSGPSHGTLSGTAPSLTYTPNAGSTGADSFTYSVTDTSTYAGNSVSYDGGAMSITLETPSQLTGSVGTITLQPYSAPVAQPQSVTATFNSPVTVTLAGTDSNGATLTYSIVATPASGTLGTLNGNAVTYAPANDFTGADSFTFKVNDGVSDSAPGTVSVTVNPAPPTPNNQNVSVNFQTATPITLSATGQGTLTYTVATPPAHGVLTGTAPNLTYTPSDTYSGPDMFTFNVSNAGGSGVGTVNIAVGQPPATPVAQNRSVTVGFNTPTPITAVAGGGNGTALIYSVVSAAAHGTLSTFTGATLIYTPATGYVGADSLSFKATDGVNTSNAATISITVNPAAPVAGNQSITTAFETASPVTLSATGAGTLTYAVVAPPAHGALSGTAPSLTYTPATGYSGADSFTFKANNGTDSNVATVSITVNAPGAPVAANQSVRASSGTAAAIVLSSTGSGTITYAIATQPTHGMLTGTAPNLTYTPATGYVGADSFTFTATNPGGSSTGTVSITVNPAPPIAQAQSAVVAFNSPASILLTATGGGALAYSLVAMPTHGAVVLSGATATYTPATGYTGADSFSFKANNGSDSNVAVVSLTINPPVPVAANQAVTVSYNTPQTITLSAAGTGTLSYALVAQPANGTLAGSGASLTYTPQTNFAGADSFTFTATNSGGVSNIATVSITVVGAFTWTAASGGSPSATVNAGQTATYNLLVTGWTGSNGPVAFSCAGVPMACTASPNPATLNGTTAVPVTVSVVTTSPAATSGFAWSAHSGSSRRWLLLFSMAWLTVFVPLARRRELKLHLTCMLAVLMIVGGISGCGSVPQQPFTTPAGNYTLTVTATAAAVSTSQTLTLTVK